MPHKDPVARAAYQKEYHKKYAAENKEKKAATSKKWKEENPERVAINNKRYRQNNRKKLAERSKKWAEENKEEVIATRKRYAAANPDYQLLYRRKNPDKVSNQYHRRRAQKIGNGVFTITTRFMKNLYNSPCRYCGANESITADHIIPIHRGGIHSEGNLQPLCGSCNSSKGAKLWIEFIAQKKG